MQNAESKLKQDYFTFLGLETKYSINQAQLKQQFLRTQAILHPDRNMQNQSMLTQLSSYSNSAYNTLKNDALRAIYWCNLHKINLENIKADDSVIEQTLQWYEEIEENITNINKIQQQAQQVIEIYQQQFNILSLNLDTSINKNELAKIAINLLMLDKFFKNTYF